MMNNIRPRPKLAHVSTTGRFMACAVRSSLTVVPTTMPKRGWRSSTWRSVFGLYNGKFGARPLVLTVPIILTLNSWANLPKRAVTAVVPAGMPRVFRFPDREIRPRFVAQRIRPLALHPFSSRASTRRRTVRPPTTLTDVEPRGTSTIGGPGGSQSVDFAGVLGLLATFSSWAGFSRNHRLESTIWQWEP